MIGDKQYRDWSHKFHSDHNKEPIVVQLELTYSCLLHCLHCYSDCYNNKKYRKKELSTKELKKLMDKLYDAGCLWLTFTGGEPMMRDDFTQLYDYAKKKGFILSVMSSLAALTDEILEKMSSEPPFSIETTLNGVTESTYERISGVKGSFRKVMLNIEKVLTRRIPLIIKALISNNNMHEADKIRGFAESKGLIFKGSSSIYPMLNGDNSPCRHRLKAPEVIAMNFPETDCEATLKENGEPAAKVLRRPNRFFKCAAGSWRWQVDPRGRLSLCTYVREPSYDILYGDVKEAVAALSGYVKNKRFSKDTECKNCRIYYMCQSCPGKAGLEVRDEEAPVPYFCDLAKRKAEKLKIEVY